MPLFTPGERNVMRLLWKHGEMRPGEIQNLYPGPIKNPALRSYLTILHEKGHVTRRKVGKAFVYKAVTRRQSAFQKTLRELLDTYCDGSTHALLLNLIRSEKLDHDELLRLARLADLDPRESDKTKKRARP
ncbi:MAG: BlaI/MecI/CopY family transcriptional regulator [Pirellulales bacterium]